MSKAVETRLNILKKAFDLVYRNGYQATSVDDIIAGTSVTKGAFFYHFKTKDDMGLAMINEIMYPGMYDVMIRPLTAAKDPVKEIYVMVQQLLMAPFFDVKYGCPAVNLTEEMSPLNDSFKEALAKLINQWQDAIKKSIKQGQATGNIKTSVDAKHVACFIVAGYTGIRNMGKALGPSCYSTYLQGLKIYLSTLH